jgi:hypothetical protein
MNLGRRVFGSTIVIGLCAFACYFFYALATYSATRIVPVFALRWESAEAFRGFFAALPAIQFLGLAVALGSAKGKAEELVQGSIAPAAILSALLAAVSLIGGPQVEATGAAIKSASSTFSTSLGSARTNRLAGDLKRAREELGVCQAISRKDPRVEEEDKLLGNAELKALIAKSPLPAPETPPPKDPVAAKDYYLKALAFSEKGDFFSANWYASTAARLDPSYTDARRLAATSWEELHKKAADPADKARADFYAKKLEGYDLLRSGDSVGAYRVFKELSDPVEKDAPKHADDADVRRYLAESLSAMEKAAFFKDEVDAALSASLAPDVFFRVPSTGAAAPLRMIAAKDAAWSGGALYFREFEYLEGGPAGPRALARSPYAKLIDGTILLVCVERNRPANVYRPLWSAGPVSGAANQITLPLAPEFAYRALSARVDPAGLSLLESWRAVAGAKAYGIDSSPLIDDLLARSAQPFAIFTAAALGALAGARFRRKGGNFPKAYYALVPLMALAIVPIFLLTGRIDALISAWSAKTASGLLALLVAAGIRTAVLFLAVLLMAGARDVDGAAAD